VLKIRQGFKGQVDDPAFGAPADVSDEADATRVVLEVAAVEILVAQGLLGTALLGTVSVHRPSTMSAES